MIDTCVVSELRKPIPQDSVLAWFQACDEKEILISRVKPEMNLEELRLKGYCHLFDSDLFAMSPEEIREYFSLSGLDISPASRRGSTGSPRAGSRPST